MSFSTDHVRLVVEDHWPDSCTDNKDRLARIMLRQCCDEIDRLNEVLQYVAAAESDACHMAQELYRRGREAQRQFELQVANAKLDAAAEAAAWPDKTNANARSHFNPDVVALTKSRLNDKITARNQALVTIHQLTREPDTSLAGLSNVVAKMLRDAGIEVEA